MLTKLVKIGLRVLLGIATFAGPILIIRGIACLFIKSGYEGVFVTLLTGIPILVMSYLLGDILLE